MTDSKIAIAETDAEISRCYAVMRELRPQFQNAAEFVSRVRRQQQAGYALVSLEIDGEVRAVAGYRFLETLFSERMLYVDDLVTGSEYRSRGYGGYLLDWLVQHAREHGCTDLELDSRVQRFEAHRFYFSKRMHIEGYHFSLKIADPNTTQ